MKYVITILFLSLSVITVAQRIVIGSSQSFKQTQGRPYEYADSALVDQSHLTLIYRHERSVDTVSHTYRWSLIRMRVGDRYVQQTDMHIYLGNLRFSSMIRRLDMIPIEIIDKFGDNNPPYWADMMLNRQTGNIRITCCNFNATADPLIYEENMPEQTWKLLDGTGEVCGYKCQMAETSFRGRVWKVWYLPQLPINLGPWKLSGLPGMILKAVDLAGIYSFECIGIHSNTEPIYDYMPISKITVSRKNYLRYEKRFHFDPQSVMSEGEKIYVWQNNEHGEITDFEGVWEIPYNPIEFE